jgi:catechol 2,3-dioxygenase-like lactoylglutathione lyase family enzyme
MKRFHVHVAVDDLEANICFYSIIFGAAPSVAKTDYAKWMIEEPRINFAISIRGAKAGLDHLGFQVDSEEELGALRKQVADAEIAALDQPDAQCCYARSDKYWTTHRSLGAVQVFNGTVAQQELGWVRRKRSPTLRLCIHRVRQGRR